MRVTGGEITNQAGEVVGRVNAFFDEDGLLRFEYPREIASLPVGTYSVAELVIDGEGA